MRHNQTKKRARVFDSMKACAAALNISIDLVRRVKESGSTAFQGSRINAEQFQKDLNDLGERKKLEGKLSLRDQKLLEEIRRLKIENDESESRLISKAWVVSRIAACGSRVRGILRQKLEIEYPNAAAGLDVRGARVYGKRLVDDVLGEFQSLGSEFEQ